MCVCLCGPMDLDNHWTEMVSHYNVASCRSWKGFQLFGESNTIIHQKSAPTHKYLTLKFIIGIEENLIHISPKMV